MKFIIHNRTLLTYGLTLANLITIILFTTFSTNQQNLNDGHKDRISNTINCMDQISNNLIFSEAHVNNFILTSEASSIEHYHNTKIPLDTNLQYLEQIFQQDSLQIAKFELFKSLINKKLFDLESSIELKKQDGILSASEYLQLKKNEQYMKKIREIQNELINEQKVLLSKNQTKYQFSQKSKGYIIASASIISILISFIAIGTIATDLNKKREREKHLETINENKDKFFTLISHDLKGPAHNLIGISEILLHDKSISEEETHTFLFHLNETAKKNYMLLENLLEWSRVQMGSIALNPEIFELRELCNEVLFQAEEKAHEKNIEIENNIPENIKILADFNSIKTVLRNLVINAIKFTPINGKIILAASIYKNEATISIKDNGIGMSADIKKNLFNPGKVVSRYGTEGETGTGIGLLLCKEFINKNQGEIWTESEENKGTIFYFTLLLAPKTKTSPPKGNRIG
jgi:K+-sensing histidine kinase KdpD